MAEVCFRFLKNQIKVTSSIKKKNKKLTHKQKTKRTHSIQTSSVKQKEKLVETIFTYITGPKPVFTRLLMWVISNRVDQMYLENLKSETAPKKLFHFAF